MKTVVLDLDDFSVLNNRLDLLQQIKDHYPKFKVSLFTIPWHYEVEASTQRIFRGKALNDIKKNLDWLQLIPHGLTHMRGTFGECEKADYYTMRDLIIPSIDEAFRKDGLPYEKGFKAPFWQWNKDVVRVLDEQGWWGADDRNQPDMLHTKRRYTYSHDLTEPFWLSTNDTIKLHGHIDGVSANDLERCFLNIFKLPTDVEWRYVTDYIEEAGEDTDRPSVAG